jgi:hypothetical protein
LKKLTLFLIILIFSLSCREEIIKPDNFVENINEPVQINERNSFTFLLNAKTFSMTLSVHAYFSSIRTRFNFTLIYYESGYISITVQDFDEKERFRYFIAEDVSFHSDLLDGYIPKTITIRTEKFSGKLKIEFRRTL